MILYVCYNSTCSDFPNKVTKVCEEKFPNIEITSYDENHYHERKKAFKVKGGYSARMTPFMLLLDDNKEYLHAFYSESNECTLDSLQNFLNSKNL